MCFAFEETTDFVSVMLNIHDKTVYFIIMSRGRFKKLVDK